MALGLAQIIGIDTANPAPSNRRGATAGSEREETMIRPDEFMTEGNNGGDIFLIRHLQDGRVSLKVGHCCVYEIDHIVPAEFLTSVLVNAVLDAGGVTEAMKKVGWPAEYVERLVKQIERQ